jgi:hypothetical protein
LYEIDFCLTSVILARNVAHASLPDAPLCWVHSSVGGKRRKTRRRKQTIKAAARRSISSFSDECKSSDRRARNWRCNYECPPDHDHVVSSPRMLHIGHGSCTSSVQYSSVSTSIIGTRRQIRSLDNDLPRLGEVLPGENDIGVDQQPDERLRGMELVHRHIESDVTSS